MHSRATTPRAAVLLGMLAGCGLISSDITAITFDLPAKRFTFDTAGWTAPPSTYNVAVPCGAGQAVADCCHPPAPAPTPDCAATPLICASSVCALQFPINVSQSINLKNEVPALAGQAASSLTITIKQISYTIVSGMNVPLPPIDVYVAPASVTSADDPSATKFGTIPATPAGATQSGNVALDPAGQTALSQYMSQFSTPFNLIGHAVMVVPSGSPTPAGKVDATVTGKISAKPNL